MDTGEQLSLDDLLGFTPPLEHTRPVAEKILKKWSEKSGRNKKSVDSAIELFAQKLLDGVPKDDLKYIVNQRTLLSSHKTISDHDLTWALQRVEKDRLAGSQAYLVFREWYEEFFKENYIQDPGQIVPIIKKMLLRDIDLRVLRLALRMLGQNQVVITETSLQYAITRAKNHLLKQQDAGSRASDLDKARERQLFDADHDQEVYYKTEGLPF